MAAIKDLHPGRAVILPNGSFGVVKKVDLTHKPKSVYVHVPHLRMGWFAAGDLKAIGHARRKPPAGHHATKPHPLTIVEKHQLRIARQTLRLSDAGARAMGGPSKSQARETIRRLTGKEPRG